MAALSTFFRTRVDVSRIWRMFSHSEQLLDLLPARVSASPAVRHVKVRVAQMNGGDFHLPSALAKNTWCPVYYTWWLFQLVTD